MHIFNIVFFPERQGEDESIKVLNIGHKQPVIDGVVSQPDGMVEGMGKLEGKGVPGDG